MIMCYCFVALLILQQSLASSQRIDIPGWVPLPGQPTEEELRCTDYSESFWSLSFTDGRIKPVPCPIREHLDDLPFSYEPGTDRAGNRYVRRLSDGWLVGFDNGEFGGGLWWFSPDGQQARRLRPPADAPASPQDAFRAENVLGLPSVGTEQFVLMGLDHLGGRSGRVFKLVSREGRWALAPVAVLDSEPDPWLAEDDELLIVIETGIWTLRANGDLKKLYEISLGRFSPSSVVRGLDGALYLGLRHYVLRLAKEESKWSETWFVPSDCRNVRLVDYRCVCVP
jgi:hypothetical protein